MIFKMKMSPLDKNPVDHYLLVEGDANGTFIAIYDDIEKAKRVDGAIGLVVLPNDVLAKCQEERYSILDDNLEKRVVVDTYA